VLSLRFQLTPLDFDGSIQIQASINGYPENQVSTTGNYSTKVIPIFKQSQERGMWLHVRTRNSAELGMASVLKLSGLMRLWNSQYSRLPTLETTFSVSAGQTSPGENSLHLPRGESPSNSQRQIN